MQRNINLIVIHCSATPSGKPLIQGKPGQPGYLNAPQVINAWHAERGFRRQPAAVRAFSTRLPSIGYHYVIDLTGEVWSGRGLNEMGAHAAGFNAHSVGICLVGGAEREAAYTPAQWDSLAQMVRMLSEQFLVPLAPALNGQNRLGVMGHRDLSPDANGNGTVEPREWLKTCPGFDVSTWLSRGLKPLPQHILGEA